MLKIPIRNQIRKNGEKMSKVQVIANNVRQGVQEFFRAKTRKEDFNYLPRNSRLPLARVREVEVSKVVWAGKSFPRYAYEQEQVRGARARV